MTDYQKPQTPEEIISDRENHPERGKVNGEDILDDHTKKSVTARIPRGLHSRLLLACAAHGLGKQQGVAWAISSWINTPETINAVHAYVALTAKQHNITEEEAIRKIFGAYKRQARAHRERLNKPDQAE